MGASSHDRLIRKRHHQNLFIVNIKFFSFCFIYGCKDDKIFLFVQEKFQFSTENIFTTSKTLFFLLAIIEKIVW